MRAVTVCVVALAAMVLLGGCLGPTSFSPSRADTTSTPTPTATSTATATPLPVSSLPDPTQCLTDAVPRPDAVDSVQPSPYPEPPAVLTRSSLANWTQAFETAYFRNGLLAEEPSDDDHNLTEVSAYAELRSVNHTPRGYILRFSDSGARNYASGLHGDRWMDVGYLINTTHVVRVPLEARDGPVRASEGTVVVHCQ